MFVDILHMSVVLIISLFCLSSILHSACENITIFFIYSCQIDLFSYLVYQSLNKTITNIKAWTYKQIQILMSLVLLDHVSGCNGKHLTFPLPSSWSLFRISVFSSYYDIKNTFTLSYFMFTKVGRLESIYKCKYISILLRNCQIVWPRVFVSASPPRSS